MSEFIELIGTDAFEPGTMRWVEADDHGFLVARVGDEFYVTDARCAHLGGNLSHGVLEGSVVTCPLHHSQFDLKDGRVVRWTDWSGMALSVATLARHPRSIRAYESKVEDGKVWVGPQKPSPPEQ
jgi:3-phenylpropionate/trans-cinnamate dioxygenase ferredoxin component